MAINIRQKGAGGELQMIALLEPIIRAEMAAQGLALPEVPIVQRNQNQSAVGGNDLRGTFDISFEVKRQETLSVGSWWEQCKVAADRNGEFPVLAYRQNNKAWKFVMLVWLSLPDGGAVQHVCTIEKDPFLDWFRHWVRRKLQSGYRPTV